MVQGRRELFEEIFEENRSKLLYFASKNEYCRRAADDLVQDTLHEAWYKFDILVDHENIGGWLMQTLKNKMMNYIRDRRHTEVELTEDMADHDDLDDKIIMRSQLAAVWEFINSHFKPDDIYLFKRIMVDGVGHNVVSKELGITIWAGQKRLERIRKRIREEFPDF